MIIGVDERSPTCNRRSGTPEENFKSRVAKISYRRLAQISYSGTEVLQGRDRLCTKDTLTTHACTSSDWRTDVHDRCGALNQRATTTCIAKVSDKGSRAEYSTCDNERAE